MRKLFLLLLLILAIPTSAYASGKWEYKVQPSDTTDVIDFAVTSADIDTANNEIRLPQNTASLISFWPGDSPDFIVTTSTKIVHYSFNGSKYIANTVLELSTVDTPKMIAASNPSPDLKVGVGAEIKHMSFDGSSYVENTPFNKIGMNDAFTLSAKNAGDFLTLVNNEAQRYMFDGSSIVRVPAMEPGISLDTPVDAALFPDSNYIATLEQDKLRVFRWDNQGNKLSTLTLESNINNPKDLTTSGAGEIAIVVGNQVKHYNYSGSNWVYNSSLSVTSGLTNPKAVALRGNSQDMIIIDGNTLKYYRLQGDNLVYDSTKSVTVPDLGSVTYRPKAIVQSLAKDPISNANKVRVLAHHELPAGTSVTWSVTADGVSWVKKWRVRGTDTDTVCEISSNNGTTWTTLGDASEAIPDKNREDFWTDVPPGIKVKWKAELSTNNIHVTPKILPAVAGGIAVLWTAGTPPNTPIIDLPPEGTCFVITTPTIRFSYTDPDGDALFAHQVILKRKGDGAVVYDSGQLISDILEHKIRGSDNPAEPSTLWKSGSYEFIIQLRVCDDTGMYSPWSNAGEFCLMGFERPRIAEIIAPPATQTAPTLETATTHIIVKEGTKKEDLPKTKAGGRIKLYVDSIGPVTSLTTVKFPYLTRESTLKVPIGSLNPVGNVVNRWEIDFWTDANLEICPTGTLVEMQLTGNCDTRGIITLNAPSYAAGIVVTEGSIYEDWFPVLTGRDQ